MRSGVFRWSEEAKSLAASAALTWSEVSLDGVSTKEALMQRLSAALGCPPGFGSNWDALADSLQDLSWRNGGRHVLVLRGVPMYAAGFPADWRTLKAILEESAEFWACNGRGTLVILLDSGEFPRWDAR